jgi:hypothetical protein
VMLNGKLRRHAQASASMRRPFFASMRTLQGRRPQNK